MAKSKKVLITIIPIFVLVLILFTPIPKNETLLEGTATSLNSITYKIIFWNLFEDSDKPYNKTELVLPPNNFSSVQTILETREDDLKNEGYGAISVTVSVEKIENDWIWIKELSNDKNSIKDTIISMNSIQKYGKNIATEDIKENILLKITSDGLILESYPSKFSRIYSIELVNVKTTETIVNTPPTEDNNSSEAQTENPSQETTTSDVTTSSNTQSTYTQSSVHENTSSVITSSTTSQDSYVPLFWNQTMHRFDDYYDEISNINIPYRVIEPRDYDPNKQYPVILFLHGAGERYNGVNDVTKNKAQVSALINSYFYNYEWVNQALIIAPQISINDWWNFGYNDDGTLDAAMRIFEKVTSEYSCDSSRYYVTGLSMGGYGTWQVATRYNDVFAAAMPLCGWWIPDSAPQLLDIPIRIIHGTDDGTVSVNNSIEMYDAIVNAGGTKAILKLYENVDHDVWTPSYKDEETWEWLFSQKKE